MPVAVEYALVGLIVGAALFALGRRFVRFVTGGQAGCGTSCGRCESTGKAIKEGTLKPLVQLDLSPRDKESLNSQGQKRLEATNELNPRRR